jgi:hypothetical protein
VLRSPRYFFHTIENGIALDDDIGVECLDDADARKAPIATLPEMAGDSLP